LYTKNTDFPGQVEAVGTTVQQFLAGEKVYGDISRGGFTEYVCVAEDKLVMKPANLSFDADQVINYTSEDFTQNGQLYDLILDNVANRSVSDMKRLLGPRGTYLLNVYSPALMFQLMLHSGKSKKRGQIMRNADVAKANQSDLEYLKELLEAGNVVPVIDSVYPLSEAAEATRYLKEGLARGKVVLTVEHKN
jgi:NADPH:quinone reductase-like Zn-dependent oxidoreductase